MNQIALDEVVPLVRKCMRGKKKKELPIDEHTQLRDLGLSSLQIVEIVMALEDAYGVSFESVRAAQARTLGDLIVAGNAALRDRVG
jgi:acyl carrier protein